MSNLIPDYAARNPLPLDVISIQSQVVYGTVGNNAALPTLAAHGLRAAAVPTVLFSNTPHYDTIHGGAIPADWFAGYLADLDRRRALASTRAVILGYLGSTEQATLLADWLDALKARAPTIHIGIDPVLGDDNCGLYVRPELAACYRERLAACADLITPNHYELGYLSGTAPQHEAETVAAARSLLGARLHTVVVTSSPGGDSDHIANLIVTRDNVATTRHPRIASDVKGTGDAFHAALTAALLTGKPLQDAVQQAGDWVVSALRHTAAHDYGELDFPPRGA